MRKFPHHRKLEYLLVVLLGSIPLSCQKSPTDQSATGEVTLHSVISNLGGTDYLSNVKTIGYNVVGTTVEYDQSGPSLPGGVTTSAYQCRVASAIATRRASFTYTLLNFTYPVFLNAPPYKIIINDTAGIVKGYFDWQYYYTDKKQQSILFANRIEAVLKNLQMSNPIAVVKELSGKLNLNTVSVNRSFTVPSAVPGFNLELTIDPKTLLPTAASTVEEDFLKGDMTFKVEFKEWKKVENTWYPQRIFFKLNEDIIREEIISNVDINPAVPDDEFKVDIQNDKPYDKASARMGMIASQWFQRLGARGMIYDQPMNNGAVRMEDVDLSDAGNISQRISDDVRIIGRPDVNLWSVAIRTANGIIVVEAPLNPDWTRSILQCVQRTFPGEKITGIIPTHSHSDHLGGIREAVYTAGKVYATAEAIPVIKQALNSKFTLPLDSLANHPPNYTIEEVRGMKSIAGNQIHILPFKKQDLSGNPFVMDNSHSFDMVIVYVPSERLLIQGDVFNAGIFLNILKGKTPRQFLPPVRAEFKKRALFLLDFIQERQLEVEKVMGIHGGLSTIEELKQVASF